LLVRSRLAEAQKKTDEAVGLLIAALTTLRTEALPLCDGVTRALNRARTLAKAHPPHALSLLRALASAPFAVYQGERQRRTAREVIGTRSSDPEVCAEAFAARHGRTTYGLVTLLARVSCFERVASPELEPAKEELFAFLENEPESFGTLDTESAPPEGQASDD
jgi:hypothetical protein